MTDTSTPDRYDGLPAEWSDSAKETFVQIDGANALDAITSAALYEACALIALADQLSARVAADGPMVDGSQGQPVAHPLISESRQARVGALSGLRALSVQLGQSTASRSGAALAARRWHGRTPGVRDGR